MSLCLVFVLALSTPAHVLQVDVPAPGYQVVGDMLLVEDAAYINASGTPNLPCRMITLALPPGAIVESVQFHGTRQEVGTVTIPPVHPMLPIMRDEDLVARILKTYEAKKDEFYSSDGLYPEAYGELLSTGGLRKYTLVNVACFHFAYRPVSKKLYFVPNITVEINYIMPDLESHRAKFWKDLKDDATFDGIAQEIIYNWRDVGDWYKTDSQEKANGYTIIIPFSLVSSVDNLAAYRESQGYNVEIVPREYIESNVTGNDTPQKIRNYLRSNLANTSYVLLVGFYTDMPWRSVVPFNNDPDTPWNDPRMSPIPTDLYYADLTDHDSLSWNSDGDEYYGEVYDANMNHNGEDDPDYHADIHVGRIPFSQASIIEDICDKMIAFDSNTDLSYKKASLLAGSMIYFQNENYSGYPRYDGADMMEKLMNDSVLDRSNAVYLYEKEGLGACPYTCTDPITRENMYTYWNNKGVVVEYNHGSEDAYYRKIWAWDDGDGVAEHSEIEHPLCLHKIDAVNLDNEYPATTFLRSCSCGKPEVYGLGAQLLYNGSSAVFSSTRVAWVGPENDAGLAYRIFKRLMKDVTLSNGIVGNAYDLARIDFMDETGHWMNTYLYNMYGDPALRQFGIVVGVQEYPERARVNSFSVFPNPTSGQVTIQLSSTQKKRVELDVYDVSGRFVQQLHNGPVKQSTKTVNMDLPTGVYFLRLREGEAVAFGKVIIVD